MKQIRKRLTYANVMSSIAVFMVLGGATAIAAKNLPKKSIGTPQLKANAVKTPKIAKNAVNTAKLKKNAVATPKIRNNAVTGQKVNESTLGEVPSAANATTAANATSFNGTTQQIIKYRATAGDGETTVFSGGGLKITAACNGVAPDVGVFRATTDVNDSSIWSSGYSTNKDLDFDVGEVFDFTPTSTERNDAYSIIYQQGIDGPIVTAEIGTREYNDTPGNSDCQLTGRVLVG